MEQGASRKNDLLKHPASEDINGKVAMENESHGLTDLWARAEATETQGQDLRALGAVAPSVANRNTANPQQRGQDTSGERGQSPLQPTRDASTVYTSPTVPMASLFKGVGRSADAERTAIALASPLIFPYAKFREK